MPKKKRKRGGQPPDRHLGDRVTMEKTEFLSEEMGVTDFSQARLKRIMLAEDASSNKLRGVKKEALSAMNLMVNYFLKDLVVQVARQAMKGKKVTKALKLKTGDLQAVIGNDENFKYLETIFTNANDSKTVAKIVEEGTAKRRRKVERVKQSDILQPETILQLAATAGESSWSVKRSSQIEGEVMIFDDEGDSGSDDDW